MTWQSRWPLRAQIWRAPNMVFKSNWRWQGRFQSIKLPSVPKSIIADTENKFSGEVISWIRVKKHVGVAVVEVWLANRPPFTGEPDLLVVLHNWHHCWQPTTEVGKTSTALSIFVHVQCHHTSWALSEQRRLSSKSSWRHISSESTYSPNSAYMSYISNPNPHLISPSLLFTNIAFHIIFHSSVLVYDC